MKHFISVLIAFGILASLVGCSINTVSNSLDETELNTIPHEDMTTEALTEEATEHVTESPTEETTESATEEPAEEPTEPITEPPTEASTETPANLTAEEILAQMTLEEKICQMFIIAPENLMEKWNITTVDSEMINRLNKYPVGGYIFFKANVVNPNQLTTMINNLQNWSKENTNLPFFTAIDEEGGRVLKIGANANFPVTKVGAMSTITTREKAYEAGDIIGKYLKYYGLNFNFAPDADVITNPENQIIGDRSFGSDASVVSEFAVAYSQGLQSNGILSTFKHFPGHGATKGDTHEGFAYTSKTLEELMESELVPFKAAAENGVDAVMVAHISVPTILGDNTPCSLSKYMVTDVLRNELGFEGLIVTDALDMGAITNTYGDGEAAVMAVLAGNDILLKPNNFFASYEGVLNAVRNGVISEERIDESVKRIISVKLSLKK